MNSASPSRVQPIGADAASPSLQAVSAPAAGTARILIVDDDERNLVALAEVLSDIADAVCASSGEEALRHLLREEFAVIILDVLMPDMDGYETARLIRTREQSRDTPIIFLTAINKEDAHLLKGYDSGAVDYIFKPLQPLIVRSKVSVFVSLYEKTREIEAKAIAQEQLLNDRLAAELARARATEALRQAEERQELLLKSLPLALYTSDLVGPPSFVAGNIHAITGFAPEVFAGNPQLWNERIHPEDRRVTELLVPEGGRTREFRWRHADGEYRYLLDQAVSLEGRPGQVAGTLRDVTEQHELQERLIQSQKIDAVGKLTGGIAHDFNNLLASVLGGLSLIERRTTLDDRAKEIVEMTRHAAGQGKQLVDRLLAFSRRQPLSPQALEFAGIAQSLDGLLGPVLGGLVSLRWDVPADIWPLFADRAQLELAVMNIVINARDAMPSGGLISVGARNHSIAAATPDLKPGHYVAVTITDAGSGIPAELIDKVIEPFFTTKEVGKGTGLGLSTAYGFARQSGGALRLTSVMGVGTTVEIVLPRADVVAEVDDGTPPAEPGARPIEGTTILVVEDNPSLRNFTEAQLKEEGFSVVAVAGGAEALAMIERSPQLFDVIVTDFAMPVISGLDVIRYARSVKPNYPAVIVTGYADTSVISGRPSNVPLIPKPFSTAQLTRAIQLAISDAS